MGCGFLDLPVSPDFGLAVCLGLRPEFSDGSKMYLILVYSFFSCYKDKISDF